MHYFGRSERDLICDSGNGSRAHRASRRKCPGNRSLKSEHARGKAGLPMPSAVQQAVRPFSFMPPSSGASSPGVTLRVRRFVEFQQEVSPSDSSLVQLCVIDHSDPDFTSTPHIHLQAVYSDASRSPWHTLDGANLFDLHDALQQMPTNKCPLRIHVHDSNQPRARKPTPEHLRAALPRLPLDDPNPRGVLDFGEPRDASDEAASNEEDDDGD